MTEEWTPARVASLIAWWNEGIAASEIGRRLDVTKNAVIGKAFRLHLAKRRPSAPAPSEDRSVIRLEGLGAGMCSWPLSAHDEGAFHFCGAETVPGKPYCATHCRQAYLPPAKAKKLAVGG